MRIINIVDNATKINFGIWNAALSTFDRLKANYGVHSELWFPDEEDTLIPESIPSVRLENLRTNQIDTLIKERELDPTDTIIHTHGCWQFPTRWGNYFKKLGYKWIYVPHGMLEPWSLQQRKLRKKLYFNFLEKRMAQNADIIRAVGSPEKVNLTKLFEDLDRIKLIPNGIPAFSADLSLKQDEPQIVLFLSRLHHKKGVTELVAAWAKTSIAHNPKFKLVIAGPDQGELGRINAILKQHPVNNVEYVGPVYNRAKEDLLEKANYFILPSHSEGFPTSILEAMSYGLIPIISDGCNFPELFTLDMAIRVSPKVEDIVKGLERIEQIKLKNLREQQLLGMQFVNKYYSLSQIARQQYEHFSALFNQDALARA